MTKRKSARIPANKQTKTDKLKSLLTSTGGVTVEDLSQKLGWQTHTTRAALTRLKQAGANVEKLSPKDGSRHSRYRIAKSKA
ncbi:MAG: DUF3489 domain-containing protein [Lewinella sp.]|nr:DUF3489 domain-containing protein [Lewinella sp.]